MKKLKVLLHIIKTTGRSKIILSFVFYLSAAAIILTMIEPDINNPSDSLWFCFASTTTIGYGDIVVQTTAGRLLTVVLEFTDKPERLEALSKEALSALSESVRKNRYHLK